MTLSAQVIKLLRTPECVELLVFPEPPYFPSLAIDDDWLYEGPVDKRR